MAMIAPVLAVVVASFGIQAAAMGKCWASKEAPKANYLYGSHRRTLRLPARRVESVTIRSIADIPWPVVAREHAARLFRAAVLAGNETAAQDQGGQGDKPARLFGVGDFGDARSG